MEAHAELVFLFIPLIFQLADSATIVVDGVSKWRNPTVHVREGEKLSIKVSLSPSENMAASPEMSSVAAPSPTSGGIVSSSPAYSWPLQPGESASPCPAPSAIPPATSPALLPENGGGIPFINSNPAVPLPTGEVDSATIRPGPTSGYGEQVLGLFAVQMAPLFCGFTAAAMKSSFFVVSLLLL